MNATTSGACAISRKICWNYITSAVDKATIVPILAGGRKALPLREERSGKVFARTSLARHCSLDQGNVLVGGL
jgi:hypothetical protein